MNPEEFDNVEISQFVRFQQTSGSQALARQIETDFGSSIAMLLDFVLELIE